MFTREGTWECLPSASSAAFLCLFGLSSPLVLISVPSMLNGFRSSDQRADEHARPLVAGISMSFSHVRYLHSREKVDAERDSSSNTLGNWMVDHKFIQGSNPVIHLHVGCCCQFLSLRFKCTCTCNRVVHSTFSRFHFKTYLIILF